MGLTLYIRLNLHFKLFLKCIKLLSSESISVLVSSKIGCTPETMRKWVRRAECEQGLRGGVTTSERERTAELERENRELKRANEILRKAAAFFAQAELDRRVK